MRYTARQKQKILYKVLKERKSISEVCKKAGISRKTFYQWKKKYQKAPNRIKKQALKSSYTSGENHPKSKRHQFKDQIISIVVHYPSWGSRRIAKDISKDRQKISNHAIYKLLKDLKLETKEKREEFSSLYQTFARIEKIYRREPFRRGQYCTRLRLTPESRKRAIEEVLIGRKPVSRVCQKYHLSRKSFYKWLSRYQKAKEKEAVFLRALEDNYVKSFAHPRSIAKEIQEKILHLVAQCPELSSHKVAQILSEVGNHGVQNVFRRLNLNTYKKRLAYSQSISRRTVITPDFGLLDWLKQLAG